MVGKHAGARSLLIGACAARRGGPSNRSWGETDPGEYLRRIEAGAAREVDVRECTESHLVDYDVLVDGRGLGLAGRYDRFVERRAERMAAEMCWAMGAEGLFGA